ncbi:MAG: DUF167 domain-containing protein [Spirochaetota bacterium]|nr:DUF167 domain-containing protein [Spirochaetota bacterium]
MEKAIIDIIVSPKSSKSKIVKYSASNLKIYLNSPPVDGMANEECIGLLSKRLRISKSRIEIIKGKKGKRKRIAIQGISKDDVLRSIEG